MLCSRGIILEIFNDLQERLREDVFPDLVMKIKIKLIGSDEFEKLDIRSPVS